MVTWQGDMSGQAMQGLMTRQLPGGQVETFRFIGIHHESRPGDTAET